MTDAPRQDAPDAETPLSANPSAAEVRARFDELLDNMPAHYDHGVWDDAVVAWFLVQEVRDAIARARERVPSEPTDGVPEHGDGDRAVGMYLDLIADEGDITGHATALIRYAGRRLRWLAFERNRVASEALAPMLAAALAPHAPEPRDTIAAFLRDWEASGEPNPWMFLRAAFTHAPEPEKPVLIGGDIEGQARAWLGLVARLRAHDKLYDTVLGTGYAKALASIDRAFATPPQRAGVTEEMVREEFDRAFAGIAKWRDLTDLMRSRYVTFVNAASRVAPQGGET